MLVCAYQLIHYVDVGRIVLQLRLWLDAAYIWIVIRRSHSTDYRTEGSLLDIYGKGIRRLFRLGRLEIYDFRLGVDEEVLIYAHCICHVLRVSRKVIEYELCLADTAQIGDYRLKALSHHDIIINEGSGMG